jgi:hypothetical protein
VQRTWGNVCFALLPSTEHCHAPVDVMRYVKISPMYEMIREKENTSSSVLGSPSLKSSVAAGGATPVILRMN